MKLTTILAVILIIISGCTTQQISSTEQLALDEQEIDELAITESHCETEQFETHERAPLAERTRCQYNVSSINTTITLILKKYTNFEDLNGSYQYDSSHLFSQEGLISENTYGDQSKFRVSSEEDYGGQYNDPNVYYYHLWITEELYLIHITSAGSQEAKATIEQMADMIMARFG